MTTRCYRGCGRRARFVVGDTGTAWPACWRHLPAVLRTARVWKRTGLNDRIRVERAR